MNCLYLSGNLFHEVLRLIYGKKCFNRSTIKQTPFASFANTKGLAWVLPGALAIPIRTTSFPDLFVPCSMPVNLQNMHAVNVKIPLTPLLQVQA